MNNISTVRNLFVDGDFFYVTTDVKRALGLENIIPLHIITSSFDPLIRILREQNVPVFCLEEELESGSILPKSSGSILRHPGVKKYIAAQSKQPLILSFKPSEGIDKSCEENRNYIYIGNKRWLNEEFEDKVKFYSVLKNNFPDYLIPSLVSEFSQLNFVTLTEEFGDFLVIQFGKGWAGNTTFFVDGKATFEELQKKFPQTVVRISKKINGSTFLNNCCIYNKKVFQSKPAIQISGISWLNKNSSMTMGREWGNTFLSKELEARIHQATENLGHVLIKSGYKGYFGVDFIVEDATNHMYITELNARFTASTPFYTKLELGQEIIPLYAYHIAEFLGKKIPGDYSSNSGIIGCEISLENAKKLETGTYQIQNNTSVVLKNDSIDPARLITGEEIVILTGQTNSLKIQTNYPVLTSPTVFDKGFEGILRTILV